MVRSDDGKIGLTVSKLAKHLQSKSDIVWQCKYHYSTYWNQGSSFKFFRNDSVNKKFSKCQFTKIVAHTSSSDGTSNNCQTRNMREPVFITTVTTKDDFKTKL